MKISRAAFLSISLFLLMPVWAVADNPKYKPSSRSSSAVDITTNDYGFSASAPDALKIGDIVPDFVVPGLGKSVALSDLRQDGPVVVLFYRGHW